MGARSEDGVVRLVRGCRRAGGRRFDRIAECSLPYDLLHANIAGECPRVAPVAAGYF